MEELSKLGASVYTCSFSEVELSNCLAEWKRKGFEVRGSVCDVSSNVEREQLMHDVTSCFDSKLHILVSSPLPLSSVKYTIKTYELMDMFVYR